jgi:hypothetical protein
MVAASGFAGPYKAPAMSPAEVRATLKRLRWLANFLDTALRLPGGFRFGADTFIGLTPVAGDIATGAHRLLFRLRGQAARSAT